MSIRVRLVLASALMLLIELSLIRWLGANVVHLAYFSNFVLLGSFLGIGLGFLRAAGRTAPRCYSLLALLGLIGFVSAYPVTVDRAGNSLIFFSSGSLGAAHVADAAGGLPRRRRRPHGVPARSSARASPSCRASRPTVSICWAAWPGSPPSRSCRSSVRPRWCGSGSPACCSPSCSAPVRRGRQHRVGRAAAGAVRLPPASRHR